MERDDRRLDTRVRQFVLTLCAVVCVLSIGMAFNPPFGQSGWFILTAIASGATGVILGFRMIMRGY